MGKPLNIDWEPVKQVAVQIGLREAARQFGISEEAVCQRSWREGWLKEQVILPEAKAIIEKHNEERGLSTAVNTKASDVLRRLADRSKLRLARGIDKGAAAVRKMDGERIVDKADKVKALVDSAAKLHGWDQSEKGSALVNINVLGIQPEGIP